MFHRDGLLCLDSCPSSLIKMTFCNVKQSRCSSHDTGGFAIGTGGGFSIVMAGGFVVGIGGGYHWNTHVQIFPTTEVKFTHPHVK